MAYRIITNNGAALYDPAIGLPKLFHSLVVTKRIAALHKGSKIVDSEDKTVWTEGGQDGLG